MSAHINNYRGKKLHGRFLIIESDDWGAIRTPSRYALEAFKNKGLDLPNSVYKNDSLASNEDLDALFNLLQSLRDNSGNPLKLTANVIMANPDFKKIKAADFKTFYFEDFRSTLLHYPQHDQSFSRWQKAITDGLFMPQFHGREHLQYNRWLKVLQAGNEDALFCFNLGATYSGLKDYSFMEAYDWDSPTDVEEQKKVVLEGLRMFENVFGFKSKSFIAPCYNWDSALEPLLQANGVKIIQGIRYQLKPTGCFDNYQRMPHSFGEINQLGLAYNVRNCFLEPSMLPAKDWVDSCLAQIATAFLWQKPAVICSHRINYIGYIDKGNRERGLRDLKTIIRKVQSKWPDVQFISTDQLDEMLALK
ncbi:hypothetical protein QWZ08_24840 [Ferruginibacter paludis]|uniref:hypothetical protein n=1 Tax=Ferruginibacter paludis TaxID=1310417 RepID=UPI0025B558DB|nr:hypothetical protein [Ferruginibacter paludis]MDN3658894.1 hypothetical protein [Ferruginibacter paludis]